MQQDGTFTVTPAVLPDSSLTVNVIGDNRDDDTETERDAGYYTFTATAKDKAGNESDSGSSTGAP